MFQDLTDIVLDVPNAYQTLSKFVDHGISAGFIPPSIQFEMPARYFLILHPYLYAVYSLLFLPSFVSAEDASAM